jgi:hypothetical protein
VAQTRVLVDMARATLEDLVEGFLRLQLGYGEEIVVNNEVGLLYDVDETENLTKKLSDLGLFIPPVNMHYRLTLFYRYQRRQLLNSHR